MRVDLYAQCWNDEAMLPFFFRHYDTFVNRYVIFDDGSTDRSLTILRGHPKVEVRPFVRSYPDSFVMSEQAFSNSCWKESRGRADWVIITDIDEHLVHPSMADYLQACLASGVTLIPALGFQMISDVFPEERETLCETYMRGAPWRKMMKSSIFNPDKIEESNFTTGRHHSEPLGRLRTPNRDEVFLLHYKYLGLERTFTRNRLLRSGLGQTDIEKKLGARYSWSLEDLQKDWKTVANLAIDVAAIRSDPSYRYPTKPWWDEYRAPAGS